jgi:hypothetical protein
MTDHRDLAAWTTGRRLLSDLASRTVVPPDESAAAWGYVGQAIATSVDENLFRVTQSAPVTGRGASGVNAWNERIGTGADFDFWWHRPGGQWITPDPRAVEGGHAAGVTDHEATESLGWEVGPQGAVFWYPAEPALAAARAVIAPRLGLSGPTTVGEFPGRMEASAYCEVLHGGDWEVLCERYPRVIDLASKTYWADWFLHLRVDEAIVPDWSAMRAAGLRGVYLSAGAYSQLEGEARVIDRRLIVVTGWAPGVMVTF